MPQQHDDTAASTAASGSTEAQPAVEEFANANSDGAVSGSTPAGTDGAAAPADAAAADAPDAPADAQREPAGSARKARAGTKAGKKAKAATGVEAGTDAAPGEAAGKKHRSHVTVRTLTALVLFALVAASLIWHTGTGTPSAIGIDEIAAICPLGALEALLASKTAVPPLIIGLAITLVLVLVFGKAFCAWVCPTNIVKRICGISDAKRKKEKTRLDVEDNERGGLSDSRNWVLGAALVSAAVCGAPVFCLICPVGLTIATFIAIWRLFSLSETTLSLIVFPLILVLELVVLRKWCRNFCPIGALMSLVARLNRTFRPRVKKDTCIHTSQGLECGACAHACPEGIDLHHADVSAPLNECTRCKSCADACPAHAIEFPVLAKRAANDHTSRRINKGSQRN